MQFPRLPIDPEMLANLSVKWVLVMVGVMLISLWILRTQPLEEFALAVFNLNAFLYVN